MLAQSVRCISVSQLSSKTAAAALWRMCFAHPAAVVAIAVGGAVLVALLAVAAVLVWRRRRAARAAQVRGLPHAGCNVVARTTVA